MNEVELLALAAAARGRDDALGGVPEGYFVNPNTGQMTSREMLENYYRKHAPQSNAGSIAMGAADTAALSLGDEFSGLVGRIAGDKDGGNFRRENARARMDAARNENPWAYTGGQIAGALPLAIGTGVPMAAGKGALGVAATGMGLGAAEGAVFGFNQAEGGALPRLKSAGIGAGIGGATGLLAPVASSVAGKVGNAIRNPASGLVELATGKASKRKANAAILDALKGSKKSVDDVGRAVATAAREGQPEYRLMDAMGFHGKRQASGIARQGGDAAEQISEYLQTRQAGQGDRISGFVGDGFGFNGQGSQVPAVRGTLEDVLAGPQVTAKRTTAALKDARGVRADANYTAARGNAAPVDTRGVIGVIDDRLGPLDGNEFAEDSIDGIFHKYRDRLVKQGPEGATELSDFNRVLNLKQDLQTEMKKYIGTPAGRELKRIEAALDEALEASSDGYRMANDTFRADSRVVDAVEGGADMAKPRIRTADNADTFGAMRPTEQAAARVGYGDDLLGKLENVTAPTANRAKALQTPKRAGDIDTMALDPELLKRRLAREDEMWGVQNRALGGSLTADNLADQEAMSGLAGGGLDVAKKALNFQLGDALEGVANIVGPKVGGKTDATRQLIAQALMSKDPVAALQAPIAQSAREASQRRMLEALLRQGAIQGAM